MKRLSEKHKKFLLLRLRKARRRRNAREAPEIKRRTSRGSAGFKPFAVEIWDGLIVREALCVGVPSIPPKRINFEDGVQETLEFLKDLRDQFGRKIPAGGVRPKLVKEKKGRLPRIKGFHDYSVIEEVSISAALVMAACYDREKRVSGKVPPAINHRNWSPDVFRVLSDVGFFEFIGHGAGANGLGPHHYNVYDNLKIVSALSGHNANGLGECSQRIQSLLEFLSYEGDDQMLLLSEINSAVSEAMINVAKHAYPPEYVASSTYDTVGQWWMTAQADRQARSLTIAIYDQGATIPGTLPRREWYKEMVSSIIKAFVPNFSYDRDRGASQTLDHEFIGYSMKEGKTQTMETERGLGLPQMQSLIDVCDSGSLTIVSRSGYYKFCKGGEVEKRYLPLDLEGTLIEWRLSLPKLDQKND